jgi:hypothetical protein
VYCGVVNHKLSIDTHPAFKHQHGNFSKIPIHITAPVFLVSAQSTAQMMVHDCDEVQNLQRQMAKSKIISNQET